MGQKLLGSASGAGLGSFVGGPAGAIAGSAIGSALQAAREAGIQNVDHLVTQAMLNPALVRVLLTKVTPQNEAMLVSSLKSQLARLSLVSAGERQERKNRQGQQGRVQASPQQNVLGATTPLNSLLVPTSNLRGFAGLVAAHQDRRNAMPQH